jgi:dTDP-4-dehydrorhamnose reductase
MKTIWVAGSKGQLGTELWLQHKNAALANFLFTDIGELDLTNEKLVREFANQHKPAIIINCAAYTNVDKAETDIDAAYKLNHFVPGLLSRVSIDNNCILVHISTDYVFNGMHCLPYTEEDPTSPQSVYGASKLAGEVEVLKNSKNLIIRTSWLYSAHGSNFLKTMLRLGKEKEMLNVIFDQVGSPTSAVDLANEILLISSRLLSDEQNFGGIYHFSNEGVCSWYDFAVEIMKIARLNCKVNPITSDKYPSLVKRPAYSVLNKSKIKNTFGLDIPHWRESLDKVYPQIIDLAKFP